MSRKIGILGTGKMGSGLARCFAAAGMSVCLGSRDPATAEAAAGAVRSATGREVESGSYREAARFGEIVVLALPFSETDSALLALEDALENKIVIDVTNPFGVAPASLSAAEIHAPLLPASASLVAAFKTTHYRLLDPAVRGETLHDVFVAGEDEASKQVVSDLVRAIGFRPIDCGGLANARVLDEMVPLLVEIARRNHSEDQFAWKFLP